MTALAEWGNFYVIVGSSAGALIGLQFVVITLIAYLPIARADAQAGGAFHNAWDTVTYHVFVRKREPREVEPPVRPKE
jgi:hypothetical protein